MEEEQKGKATDDNESAAPVSDSEQGELKGSSDGNHSDSDKTYGTQKSKSSEHVVVVEESRYEAAAEPEPQQVSPAYSRGGRNSMIDDTKAGRNSMIDTRRKSTNASDTRLVRKSLSMSKNMALVPVTMKSQRSSSSQLLDFSRIFKCMLVDSTTKVIDSLQPGLNVLKDKAALVKDSLTQVYDESKSKGGWLGGSRMQPITEKRRPKPLATAAAPDTVGAIITVLDDDTPAGQDLPKSVTPHNDTVNGEPKSQGLNSDWKKAEPDTPNALTGTRQRKSLKSARASVAPAVSPVPVAPVAPVVAPLQTGVPQEQLDELAAMRAALLAELGLNAVPPLGTDLSTIKSPIARRGSKSYGAGTSSAETNQVVLPPSNPATLTVTGAGIATSDTNTDDYELGTEYTAVVPEKQRRRRRKTDRMSKLCGHLIACTCAGDK